MKVKLYSLLTACAFLLNGQVFGAEGEEVPYPADNSFWQTLVMIGIAFLFFYVILWRPEQKRRQALEEQRGGMKKGDRVVAMGILGTIVKVNEQTVIVKMYDGALIEFYKAAISDVLSDLDENAKKVDISTEAK